MRTSELLKDCKIKLKITSDYALAKELKIPTQRIADYMKGSRTPSTYALVRIADCLGLDPLALIAEFEEQTAKNPVEKGFWASFRQRAKKPVWGLMLALLCALTLLTGPNLAGNPVGIFRRRKYA
ncbi:MAG: helix-turn-helix transcriptional regulator [Gallionella sp.]|jgi:transcriptional regulator with XRE-family HTH domain